MTDFENKEDQQSEVVSKSGVHESVLVDTIPVIHEEIQIGKKTIETGKIHIAKTVSQQYEDINVPLTTETYDINRIPVNQTFDVVPPAVRYEGDTMIISVVKEILVIEKKYELVEEFHLTKKVTEHTEIQQITLRKEEVSIERIPLNKEETGASLL